MSSEMEGGTFTRELQNGARLASLLINEGTLVLQHFFDGKIQQGFRSLNDALTQKRRVLRQYHEGRGRPKLLSEVQFRHLYPSDTSCVSDSSQFDITLLCFLLREVCNLPPPASTGNWMLTPTAQDTSPSAQVVRLRTLRNEIYGHITHTGIPCEEFEQKWAYLCGILKGLQPSGPHDFDRWKNDPLDPQAITKVKEMLYTLIANDLADLQAIATRLIIVMDSMSHSMQQAHNKEMEEIRAFSKNASQFNDFMGAMIFEMMECVGNKLGHQDLILQMITMDFNTQVEQLKQLKQHLNTRLDAQVDILHDISREQKSQSTELASFHSKILEKTEMALASLDNSSKPPIVITENLQKIKNLFMKTGDAFQILILNDAVKGHDFKGLAQAVGFVPWNLILDMDHNSQSSLGLYDEIVKILRKHKPIHTITYKETEKLSEEEKDAVAHGRKTLWIQANGCSVKDCESSLDKFAKAKFNISGLLTSALRKIPTQKSLLCTTLHLNNTASKQIRKLEEVITEACEIADDIFIEKPNFISLACAEAGFSDEKFESETEEEGKLCCVVGENQLTMLFLDLFHRDIEQNFTYPGNKGRCLMSADEMTQLLPVMDLYHGAIGKVNFEKMEAEQITNKKTEIREAYQKGYEISVEALYLNATGQEKIYVKRKEMAVMEEVLRKDLDERKHNIRTPKDQFVSTRYMSFYSVDHDACGGGTTCLRHILFSLKDDYPCIELKHLDAQVFGIIKKISTKSSLPVLIVAEGSKFTSSDVQTVQKILSNDWIQGIILHSRRIRIRKAHSDYIHSEKRFTISSQVSNETDLAEFRELYKHGQSNKQAKRVFLFGLLAFLKDYEKCDEHIHTCVSDLDSVQTSILRIVCTFYKYIHMGVKTCLLNTFWQMECKKLKKDVNKKDGLINALGYANDILVNAGEDQTEIMRPAVDFVVNPTLQVLNPGDEGERLKRFTQDLEKLVEANGEDREDTFKHLSGILITRDKAAGLYWSQFVADLEKTCGKEYVESVLLKFTQLSRHSKQGPHIRILYARYLMSQMNKPQDALAQGKEALDLQDHESVRYTIKSENILLTAYGNLHRLKVIKYFRSTLMENGVNQAMLMAQAYIQEAVFAYEKAQKSTWNAIERGRGLHTPVPFCMEAFARHLLLSFVLEHRCHNNLALFRRYVTESNSELLQESQEKGLEALAKLEFLIKQDKVHDDNPGYTSQRIIEAKFRFLRLQTDPKIAAHIEKSNSFLREAISHVPNSMAFDIGTLVRLNHGEKKQRLWSDLDKDELQFIILQIDKRISMSKVLANNYQDIIIAMIYIRQLGYSAATKGVQEYNISYAIQCATLWVDNYPSDFEAHFHLGVLSFVDGLQKYESKRILDAKASLRKCREICEKQRSTDKYRKLRYTIGKGEGLEKLVPIKPGSGVEQIGRGKHEQFTGRLVNERDILVKHGSMNSAFKANIPLWAKADSGDVLLHAKRQPMVTFNCAVSHDKIIAFNIDHHDIESSDMNSDNKNGSSDVEKP